MNNEILHYYFTDSQMAAILGITLGGLRNKIYRGTTDELPKCIDVILRTRLWSKKGVREYLLMKYSQNTEVVDTLIKRGEAMSVSVVGGKNPAGKGKKPRK